MVRAFKAAGLSTIAEPAAELEATKGQAPQTSAPLYNVPNEQFSEAFAECWRAAGQHLDAMVQDGIKSWLKAALVPPFLEHFSFRLGNQLFFVRVEDAEGRVRGPGKRGGLLMIADRCKGWPCVMPMRLGSSGQWQAESRGWGLLDARSGQPVDPIALISDEEIEMTDWELQEFGVQFVTQQLANEGRRVTSWQGTPDIDPSIWFEGEHGLEWVVVRTVRYPQQRASVPPQWKRVAERCRKFSAAGYFASVSAARAGANFVRDDPSPGRLLRGHGMYARYSGLEQVTEEEAAAAEERFIETERRKTQQERYNKPTKH